VKRESGRTVFAVGVDLGRVREGLSQTGLVLDDVALRLLVALGLVHTIGLGGTRLLSRRRAGRLGLVALLLVSRRTRLVLAARLRSLLLLLLVRALLLVLPRRRAAAALGLARAVVVLGLHDVLVDLVALARVGGGRRGLGGALVACVGVVVVVRASADHGAARLGRGGGEWEEDKGDDEGLDSAGAGEGQNGERG